MRYGKCVIDQEIGRGARSIVYLAEHEGLQIPVAVKVMKKEYGRDEDQFSERFTREARIAAQLTHTNIVRVYDCGETPEAYYLVLEYIEGESCRDKMEQWGAFDWQRAVQIVRAVADGLYYASRKGIIHRDLKPENIMIDTEGEVHLADLGLAKEVLPGESSTTADGDVLGTPYYMSPEQVRQPSDVDFRSDMYSLGATLYHMTTGEVPFEAPTPFEIMTKHLNTSLTPPGNIRPELPDELCEIIERMMAKDPADRYDGYDELIDRLDALLMEVEVPARAEQQASGTRSLGGEGQPGAVGQDQPVVDSPAMQRATRLKKDKTDATQPLRDVELPVNELAVITKLTGLVAVGLFALTVIGMAFALRNIFADPDVGGVVSTLGVLGVLLAVLGYGVFVHRGSATSSGESTHALNDKLSRMLTRLCTRFGLPTPVIHDVGRAEDTCYAYSFFSRKAALYVPVQWMREAELTDRECQAVLAHGMASVYSGDSNLRMVLGLPLGVLRLRRWVSYWLFRRRWLGADRLKQKLARLSGLGTLVMCCVLVALSFVWFWQVGIIVTGALITLFAVAAYERQLCSQCDRLALRALSSEDAAQNMITAVSLSGLNTYRVAGQARAAGLTADWQGTPADRATRESVSAAVRELFRDREQMPDTLELAGTAFALQPGLGQRLNRLAGSSAADGYLTEIIDAMRRMHATLMGRDEGNVCTLSDLASMGHYVLLGFLGGALAVALMSVLSLRRQDLEWFFVPVLGVLSVALGVALVPRATRQDAAPGRVGYATLLGAMSLCITASLGFCLAFWGQPPLYKFSSLTAMGFVPVVLVAGLAAALFVRLSPVMGLGADRADSDQGSKTAHTVMMLLEDGDEGHANASNEGPRADTAEGRAD
jgi:serine/threonine-protein kinase